jgi:hypothetical protein
MDNHLTKLETDILINNLTHLATKCDYNSYTYIKNSLDQLIIPFPAISINIGKYLFRSRRHLNNKTFFNEISDISQRPDIFNITDFGRANEPCQTIFYCSDQHEIAIAETSPILRQNLDLESDIITTGIWQVKKELRVASLLNHPLNKGQNPAQHFLDTKAKDLIESFRNEHTDQLLKLHRFISNEFLKPIDENSNKYLISCAFSNYIYGNSGYDTCLKKRTELDGLIYPSAIFPIFGMNLALKPSVITDGKLILVGARKSKLIKQNDIQYIEIETTDTQNIEFDNNRINWNMTDR